MVYLFVLALIAGTFAVAFVLGIRYAERNRPFGDACNKCIADNYEKPAMSDK